MRISARLGNSLLSLDDVVASTASTAVLYPESDSMAEYSVPIFSR